MPFIYTQEEASKKYDLPVSCLPHTNVRHVKPSHEACRGMTAEDQVELQTQAQPTVVLTEDALEKHNMRNTPGPLELRQFACPECHRHWWRTVLKTKAVSRCRGAKCGAMRYDPVPRDKEFGIGRFICPKSSCKRTFYGHCEATDVLCCKKCKTPCKPHVHPKWIKRRKEKRLNPKASSFNPKASSFNPKRFTETPKEHVTHEDLGPKFYPISSYTDTPHLVPYAASPGDLVHNMEDLFIATPPTRRNPPRQKKKIFNASNPHISSGSTVSTMLTQNDFENNGNEVDLDYDDDVDENVPGTCRFECSSCPNKYTVTCRLVDTALCFQCNTDNSPLGLENRIISALTDKTHKCSRCPLHGICPNIEEARFAMQGD